MGKPTIPTPRKRGQHGPPYRATEDKRAKVRALAGYGVPQPDIARIMGTDVKTLTRHYREDLDLGVAQANAKVGGSLHRQAVSGKCPAASIYWTKARMGWTEYAAEARELRAQVVDLLRRLNVTMGPKLKGDDEPDVAP